MCARHAAQLARRGQLRPIPQQRPVGAAQARDTEGRKQCSVCLQWRPEADYDRSPIQEDGLQPSCRPCRILITYSLPPAQHEALLTEQGGVCAVCGRTDRSGKALAVDHDHSCCSGPRSCGRCVRGLLCSRCNFGLGRFSDDPGRLRSAAAYVEGWRRREPREIPPTPKGRRDKRWYAYRVAPEGYAEMLAAQGGACALCSTKPTTRALAVDHDHSCCPRAVDGRVTCGRCVRGLLCTNCNVGLGTMDDDPIVLRRAADYVGGAVASTFLAN
ncbi:endonuclease VII domain-containing protein [Streptomyces sp. NPDC026666]